MKKIYKILVLLIICVSFSCIAFATGDPNIDGGGGGTGDGTGDSYWNAGNDGVRVTIVKISTKTAVTSSLDFTNLPPVGIQVHFGSNNKIQYRNGLKLKSYLGNYNNCVKPYSPLPQIISPSGATNIRAVKEYFSLSGTLQDVCDKVGFDYEKLLGGDYVVMLEPIVYLKYFGTKYAMTATEAALFDQIDNGNLKKKMGFLTHQNLPLAMFLERDDIGFTAWKGTVSGIQANSSILSQLGIGTVRFKEQACCNHPQNCPCIIDPENPLDCSCKKEHPNKPCDPSTPGCDCTEKPSSGADLEYRTDTDVITSFLIYDHSGNEKDGINPDMNATVSFTVGSITYEKHYVVPPGDSQLVWFKWHTPKTPQTMQIEVSATSGGVPEKSVFTAKIVELIENTPPDPQVDDLKNGMIIPDSPKKTSITHLSWGQWIPRWRPFWVWISTETGGYWVDRGWWEYDWYTYSASATMKMKIRPDDEVPTAINKGSYYEMKSGYGININLETDSSTTGVTRDDITQFQNSISTFPEFKYKTYFRVLELYENKNYNSKFRYKVNPYSFKGLRTHYTPLWFPDDMKYEVQAVVFDMWCPAGQLWVYKDDDSVYIDGDAYDDWNVAPAK